eukprot:10327122-Alexandrium_andersonii.AAC.1
MRTADDTCEPRNLRAAPTNAEDGSTCRPRGPKPGQQHKVKTRAERRRPNCGALTPRATPNGSAQENCARTAAQPNARR